MTMPHCHHFPIQYSSTAGATAYESKMYVCKGARTGRSTHSVCDPSATMREAPLAPLCHEALQGQAHVPPSEVEISCYPLNAMNGRPAHHTLVH